jgi:hypothetical protein
MSHTIFLTVHAPTEDKTDDMKNSFYEETDRVFDKFPKWHTKIFLGDFNAKVTWGRNFRTHNWEQGFTRN